MYIIPIVSALFPSQLPTVLFWKKAEIPLEIFCFLWFLSLYVFDL